MVRRLGAAARSLRMLGLGLGAAMLLAPALAAQETGTVTGRVVDERGAGISGAQVFLKQPAISTQTAPGGNYTLQRVPTGAQTVHVRMLGFSPDSVSVTVESGGTVTVTGIDLGRYRGVDISAQPMNGSGGHGESMLRGALR